MSHLAFFSSLTCILFPPYLSPSLSTSESLLDYPLPLSLLLSHPLIHSLQVILLLLMLFMRKRVALTISLFHVAGKVFIHLPLLTLQPFCTFLALLLFWLYWSLVLLFLGTTGEGGRVSRGRRQAGSGPLLNVLEAKKERGKREV